VVADVLGADGEDASFDMLPEQVAFRIVLDDSWFFKQCGDNISNISKFTINGWYKPSKYGWFIIKE